MQSPILTALDGGAGVDEAAQERAAWGRMAMAAQDALIDLHAFHPERPAFVEMWRECRQAAGMPLVPELSRLA